MSAPSSWWFPSLLFLVAGCGTSPVATEDAGGLPLDAAAPASVDMTPVIHARAPARSDYAYGYEPVSRKVVAFGGDDGKIVKTVLYPSYHDETWVYDLASGDWKASAAKGPSARGRAAFAMDTTHRRLLLTLGRGAYSKLSGTFALPTDAWAYDVATDAWSQLTLTGTAPTARHSPVSVYDAAKDRLILFGGDTGNAVDPIFGHKASAETWALTGGTTWSKVTTQGTTPPARYLAAAAFDTRRNRMVVVGGVDEMGTFYNDVWALDLAGDTWSLLDPGAGDLPTERIGHNAAYDAAADRVIVFGGHDLGALGNVNDTWAFSVGVNGATPTWMRLRGGDQEDNTVLGCGGNKSEQPYNFSKPDATSPERRERALGVAAGDRIVLYGGEGDCSQLDDTWHFFAGAWTRTIPAAKGESCLRRGDTCPCLCN